MNEMYPPVVFAAIATSFWVIPRAARTTRKAFPKSTLLLMVTNR